jgi:hypothetical protein
MRTFIAERFDAGTLINMNIALERACQALPKGSNDHKTRRYIARRIIQCAAGGDRTLGSLTKAGEIAALVLMSYSAA